MKLKFVDQGTLYRTVRVPDNHKVIDERANEQWLCSVGNDKQHECHTVADILNIVVGKVDPPTGPFCTVCGELVSKQTLEEMSFDTFDYLIRLVVSLPYCPDEPEVTDDGRIGMRFFATFNMETGEVHTQPKDLRHEAGITFMMGIHNIMACYLKSFTGTRAQKERMRIIERRLGV